MDRDPKAPSDTPLRHTIAGLVITTGLVLAGLWVLQDFLVALVWAGIFAIVLWPVYRRLVRVLPAWCARVVAPLVLVLLVGILFILPLVLLGIGIAQESHVVMRFVATARQHGIAPPDWIGQLPLAGAPLADWWRANLGDPVMVQELFGKLSPHLLAQSARQFGGEIAHRLVLFGFTLLTLFFLFRDGASLTVQLRGLSDRLVGHRGERIAGQVVAAVHGTVTGLVLVGLGEGLLIGIVYFAAHLPYPASVGAATGVAAIIPFGAPTVYCLAALYLIAQDDVVDAVIVLAGGSLVVFIADHFIRPVLIGGAARLPFLWVLLGILGGLATLGFLGLFLGPAIMAALIALWRESTENLALPQPSRTAPAPQRRSGGKRGAIRRG